MNLKLDGSVNKKILNALVLTVVFSLFIYIGSYFNLTKYIFILYVLIGCGGLFVLWTRVGHIIFTALAKSTIFFSILIFITQQYCSLQFEKQTSNQALILLYSTGLMYTFGLFFLSIRDQLFGVGDKQGELKKLEIKYKGWKYYTLIMLYIIMIFFYIYLIISVTNPVLKDLCVYNIK